MKIEDLITKYQTQIEYAVKLRDDPLISSDLYYSLGAQIVIMQGIIVDLRALTNSQIEAASLRIRSNNDAPSCWHLL
jgi:hypothetical protein